MATKTEPTETTFTHQESHEMKDEGTLEIYQCNNCTYLFGIDGVLLEIQRSKLTYTHQCDNCGSYHRIPKRRRGA